MTRRIAILVFTGLVGLLGCGGNATEGPVPLSVAEWKTMPVESKYTPETLERLKAGDPGLTTPEGWEAFNRTVLKEARRKDFPGQNARR